MSNTKLVASVVIVVFAVSLTAAGVAQASGEGAIVDLGHEALIKNSFTGKSGVVTLETEGGAAVQCKTDGIEGKFTSREAGEQTMHLKECADLGIGCTSGSKAGEITFTGMSLSFAKTAGGELLLHPSLPTAGGEFKCGVVVVKAKGSFFVPIEASQQETPKTSFSFKDSEKKGVQEPREFENYSKELVKATLEVETSVTKKYEKAGLSAIQELVVEEEAEIAGGGILWYFSSERPLKIKVGTFRAFTVEFFSAPIATSGTLEVKLTGPFVLVAPGASCRGKNLKGMELCTTVIECVGAAGETGRVEVTSESLAVIDARVGLECVP